MKILAVVPARLASTRLPEKPLIKLNGKEMIRWVYEGTQKSELIDEVVVATDSDKIVNCVENFGGKALLTSKKHKTGTDRVCEVVEKIGDKYDIIVNVQGDEPLINGRDLDMLIKPMIENSSIKISTPVKKIEKEEAKNKNTVKVVVDNNNFALYFSRESIPFISGENIEYYKHIGIYSFRKEFLLKFKGWKQTPLEKAEKLEQLRVLENGYRIKTVKWNSMLHGVDTEEDVRIVERYLKGD
ncbi:MAG: 3-deoxy-manno-octulosonate cytidylyltransferase [Candidatus Mcinerneyibacterium aminivorans]|uniref:3-deoxy-manno-octulosonate cytidylyltransferase n=1 Tax=Candidatus Mcinerneyibacterium aminivorans TaxID=2703815 RepID=A0A5D0MK94_9BACT|nr:MAG: 3-deoxy-manno-octulosonate cytidylyltransferase [Candidatus Mcinerneyibacterium aminivorans]